jgi:molybdopterin-containing oxidoreductase family iron-sulfur binding subunit
MVIDLKKCSGCGACAIACKQNNATPPGVWWNKVYQFETGIYPNCKLKFLPAACQQCEEPACLAACPTGATSNRADGIVVVDDEVCIGCGYCAWSCPYAARKLNHEEPKPYHGTKGFTPFEEIMYQRKGHKKGVVEKCNFCIERLAAGLDPACVATCPPSARVFGDLDDPNSEVSRLIRERNGQHRLEDHGTGPSVYYLDLDL